jgi:hypothetical protein
VNKGEIERLVGLAARLRWIERTRAAEVTDDLADLLADLRGDVQDLLPETVSRAMTARLLGITQTALDRWIASGDIAAVMTPTGRREVPLEQLVALLDEVEERRRLDGGRVVAAVMRDRRARATQLDPDELVPRRRRPRTHRVAETRSLAYHRAVAARLDDRLVRDARRRLKKWRTDGRIHPHWADEWTRILEKPLPEIRRVLRSSSVHATELRQSSPFAGVLTEQERTRLNDVVEARTP